MVKCSDVQTLGLTLNTEILWITACTGPIRGTGTRFNEWWTQKAYNDCSCNQSGKGWEEPGPGVVSNQLLRSIF